MNHFNRRTAFFYALAIAILGGSLAWRRADDRWPKLLFWSATTAEEAREIVQKQLTRQENEVQKRADAYKNPINEKLRSDAKAVVQSIQELEAACIAFVHFEKDSSVQIDQSRLDDFLEKWAAVRDSIFQTIDSKTSEKKPYSSLFASILDEKAVASTRARFQKLAPEQAAALARTEVLRAETAGFWAAKSLAAKAAREDFVFDAFLPVISKKRGPLRLGNDGKAHFEGEIFLSAYASTAKNLTASVNGRAVPLENGLGLWSETFQTTGRKPIQTIFTVKNPLTEQVVTYQAEYEIDIKP